MRKSGAGSMARAARRFRTIKTMMTTSKLALVAASTTTNVALLPTTPDGIESQGALGLPVGEPRFSVRASVRGWALPIRFRAVHSAARAGFCGQE